MKTRQAIIHALLSLLLLASQQIGFAHRISHWSDINASTAHKQSLEQKSRSASPQTLNLLKQSPGQLLIDQSCEQCLYFAQVGSTLATNAFSFPFKITDRNVLVVGATPFTHLRTVCVFHSRAPPALA